MPIEEKKQQETIADTVAVAYSTQSQSEEAVLEATSQIKKSDFRGQPGLCIVLYNLPKKEVEKIPQNIKSKLNPKNIIVVPCSHLVFNYKVFTRGICVICFADIEMRNSGFFDARNIREKTEKYIWRMSQDVHKPRKLFLGFSSLDDDDLSDHVKGLEVSVGKKSPMLNLFINNGKKSRDKEMIYNENRFLKGSVGTFLYEPLVCAVKTGSGFKPLGRSGEIVLAEHKHNIIETINGEPAVEFYKRYFGDKMVSSESYARRVFDRYPLGFQKDEFQYTLACPHQVLDSGALLFIQDIQGEVARLMIPTRDGLLTEVRSAALQIREKAQKKNAVLFFDSYLRYKFFGSHYDRQLRAMKDSLGDIDCVGGIFHGTISMFDTDKPQLGHSIGEHSFVMIPVG